MERNRATAKQSPQSIPLSIQTSIQPTHQSTNSNHSITIITHSHFKSHTHSSYSLHNQHFTNHAIHSISIKFNHTLPYSINQAIHSHKHKATFTSLPYLISTYPIHQPIQSIQLSQLPNHIHIAIKHIHQTINTLQTNTTIITSSIQTTNRHPYRSTPNQTTHTDQSQSLLLLSIHTSFNTMLGRITLPDATHSSHKPSSSLLLIPFTSNPFNDTNNTHSITSTTTTAFQSTHHTFSTSKPFTTQTTNTIQSMHPPNSTIGGIADSYIENNTNTTTDGWFKQQTYRQSSWEVCTCSGTRVKHTCNQLKHIPNQPTNHITIDNPQPNQSLHSHSTSYTSYSIVSTPSSL